MKDPIYLDYAATTSLAPEVQESMVACLSSKEDFGNASSQHIFGKRAKELIETAREQVAALIGTEPAAILWTSGATEANNLALKGIAEFYGRQKRYIITSQIEHKSILEPCRMLERQGFTVTYLQPKPNGLIDPVELKALIRPDTLLVSLAHVNSEIGVIQDIKSIGQFLREHNVLFHVDAAQSIGKIPIDVEEMKIDLMSLSAHKMYGPKGIGALYLRLNPAVRLAPLFHGGGQERDMRSGTLPTHQIVGMGRASSLAATRMKQDETSIQALRDLLWQGLKALPGVKLNGDEKARICHNINVCFSQFEMSQIQALMERIAVSSGAACDSVSIQSSHVLKALGLSNEEANRSIRFSLGRYTTIAEINETIHIIKEIAVI